VTTSEQIAQEVLDLKPEAFYHLDHQRKNALTDALGKYEFQGVAIRGPAHIDLRERETLPIVALVSSTIRREREYGFRPNCVVVAVHLESGKAFVGSGFRPSPSKRPSTTRQPRGSKPGETIGASRSRGVYVLDLRQLLHLTKIPGSYAVTLFSYDWRSNTTVVRVTSDEELASPGSRPSELRMRGASPAAFRSYGRGPRSPIVEGCGLGIALGRDRVSRAIPKWPLYGTVRLKVDAQHLVNPSVGVNPSESSDVRGRRVRSIVPVTLLVVGKDRKLQRIVSLAVPVFSKGALQPGDVVEAFFEINLGVILGEHLPSGTLCIYGISDRYVSSLKKLLVE